MNDKNADIPIDDETETVVVFLRSLGGAPALKQQKFKLKSCTNIFDIEKYLKKALSVSSLFLYCGSGFSPSPDQSLKELYDCFKTSSNELILSYGLQESYG